MKTNTLPRTHYRVRVDTDEFAPMGIYKGSWGWITAHPLAKFASHTGSPFALYPDEIFGAVNKNKFISISVVKDFLPQNNPLNN